MNIHRERILENLSLIVDQIGEGICQPAAYDTAWVAMVPSLNDLNRPAFPKSIEWLRNHQLEDGSWGTDKPFHAQGNILSTLASVIALKKWDQKEDKEQIENGTKALNGLFEKLSTEETESICFKIILPSLLNRAKIYGLSIEFKDMNKYNEIREKKLKFILNQFENEPLKKQNWWYYLELLDGVEGKLGEMTISDEMIEEGEYIGASPSATAFALIEARIKRGTDIPKAFRSLKILYERNNGGIPALIPADGFEQSYSLGFFIMANIPPMNEIIKPAIDKLKSLWDRSEGMIIGFRGFPPDADATAATLYVLNSCNILSGVESADTLLKFFRGSCMITYEGELNPSISININSLLALKPFKDEPKIKRVIEQILEFLENNSSNDRFIFKDKWHLSPYYPISRAIFALEGVNDSLAIRCVSQVIDNQNSDGGWGLFVNSTLEETAYACLALCYWIRSGTRQNHNQIIEVLKSAHNFIINYDGIRNNELWIMKTLYCPTLVVESAVIAAQYCLNDLLT